MNAEALKGHLDLLLLAAVQPAATHGYAIAEILRVRSGGTFDLAEGTLYPRSEGSCEGARRVARLCARRSRGGGRSRMISARVEAYLSRLQHELQKHGLADAGILDEVREHLIDAVAAGLRRGLSADAAEHETLVRFGPPEIVAAGFANERYRMSQRLMIVLSKIGGLLRGAAPPPPHYHDVGPSRYHFALRLKRPYRNRFGRMSVGEQKQSIEQMRERGEDVIAFETDPRERLVRFLEEFGRRAFGSTGTLESLTLLEDTADSTKGGGRYLAAFGGGSKMIWTVALSADGAVSFDGTSAAA